MLNIESYIIKHKKFTLNNIEKIDEGLFINIKDLNAFDKSKLDYDYLNGAISISYKDENLLGFKEWDLVDQLWYYFIDALVKLKIENNVEFSFPDQPLLVKIEKKNVDYLRLTIHDKTFNINYMDFIKAIYLSAKLFFENLVILFPENEFDIQRSIKKVYELKSVYKI